MQKIINQVEASSLLGLIYTSTVVDILKKNKDTRTRNSTYQYINTIGATFIGCSRKIDACAKTLDAMGYEYEVSELHSWSWYKTRKKEYRAGKDVGVFL